MQQHCLLSYVWEIAFYSQRFFFLNIYMSASFHKECVVGLRNLSYQANFNLSSSTKPWMWDAMSMIMDPRYWNCSESMVFFFIILFCKIILQINCSSKWHPLTCLRYTFAKETTTSDLKNFNEIYESQHFIFLSNLQHRVILTYRLKIIKGQSEEFNVNRTCNAMAKKPFRRVK